MSRIIVQTIDGPTYQGNAIVLKDTNTEIATLSADQIQSLTLADDSPPIQPPGD